MYRTGTLNSEISKVLSDLGHTDELIIADCGLPVPAGVKKIDLAVSKGLPSFLDVLSEVERHMVIEGMVMADEIKAANTDIHLAVLELGGEMKIEYVRHEEFKQRSRQAKAIIRTGEATPYANIILRSGVNF
ncbi:D-ribose pyranase [Macrococcus bovicus]|uniref:D-ribose pyranase n=1 Tax=Macrococcus bovicus TaxID=69968 RepID=A0A4R6C005_9STAP|nr:D-ribose pyranase [Macrococcus bovicus]TDM14334.1 D-ribose pyranase [Macrococcus bovicus]